MCCFIYFCVLFYLLLGVILFTLMCCFIYFVCCFIYFHALSTGPEYHETDLVHEAELGISTMSLLKTVCKEKEPTLCPLPLVENFAKFQKSCKNLYMPLTSLSNWDVWALPFFVFVKMHVYDCWPMHSLTSCLSDSSPMSFTLKVTHYTVMCVPRNRWFMYLAMKLRRSVRCPPPDCDDWNSVCCAMYSIDNVHSVLRNQRPLGKNKYYIGIFFFSHNIEWCAVSLFAALTTFFFHGEGLDISLTKSCWGGHEIKGLTREYLF